jgi:hypothetical protein
MMFTRVFSPSDLVRRAAVKRALRSYHEGAHGLPRRVVYGPTGKSEATWSRWLSDECAELPDLLELATIVAAAQDPAPLAALAAHCGEGYQVRAYGSHDHPSQEDLWREVLEATETGQDAHLELLKSLQDGDMSLGDAEALAPKLRVAIRALSRLAEKAERVIERATPSGRL